MFKYTKTHRYWQRRELQFLGLFLFSRFLLLLKRFGMSIGFDNDEHLEMVNMWEWSDWFLSIDRAFYAYHPPLGFLLAKTLAMTGISQVLSVQLLSFAASLVAFFFLRHLLKHVNLLHSPAGIVFLYVTSSIPLQLYLATSMNLDVFVLAGASAVLFFSVHALWRDASRIALRPVLMPLIIGGVIAVTMLFKFNGFLLIALPFLVALFITRKRWIPRKLVTTTLAAAVAMLVVYPYYNARYVSLTGQMFPSNNIMFHATELDEARALRDMDPLAWLGKMFIPSPMHTYGYLHRDTQHPRLRDTWKDFWISDEWLNFQPNLTPDRPTYRQSWASMSVSDWYLTIAPLLMIYGIVLLLRKKIDLLWRRLGYVLLGFALLQILSMISFVYDQPLAWAIPTKGIYIAPVVWGIGFLLSTPVMHAWKSPRTQKRIVQLALGCTAAFLLLNHLLPVY